MKTIRSERIFFWMLIVMIAALPAAYLMAQSASSPSTVNTEIRFSGAVQAGSANGVIINGVLVDTRAISGFSVPQTGAIVSVTGTLLTDGTVQASSLAEIRTGVIPGIVQLRGTLLTTPSPGVPLALQIGESFTLVDAATAEIAGNLMLGTVILVYAEQVDDPLVDWRALAVLPALADVPQPVTTPDVVAPVATLEVPAPVFTQEVFAPVSTPEVVDDDDSGRGRGRGRGGDDDGSDDSDDD